MPARSFGSKRRAGMTLATVDPHGQPSARIVLLKNLDERGFTFFTNYASHKGEELAANPRAALLFHWIGLERQVRVQGIVEKVSEAESDAYYHSRPLAQALAAGSLSDAQQKTALQILEAWYLGVVDGNVVTYEQALMYSVVSDTLVIRTYCPNQPGFWAEPPVERQA